MSVSAQELDALEGAYERGHALGFKDGYTKGYYDATIKQRDDNQKTLDRILKINPLCNASTALSPHPSASLANGLTKTK